MYQWIYNRYGETVSHVTFSPLLGVYLRNGNKQFHVHFFHDSSYGNKDTDVNWMIVCVSGVALFSNRPVIDCVFGAAKWLTVCMVLPCLDTGPWLTVSGVALFMYRPDRVHGIALFRYRPMIVPGVALFRYRPMIDCVWCCLYSCTGLWLTVWCCHVQEQAHDWLSGVALFRNTHPTECVWCCLFQKQAHNSVCSVGLVWNKPTIDCVSDVALLMNRPTIDCMSDVHFSRLIPMFILLPWRPAPQRVWRVDKDVSLINMCKYSRFVWMLSSKPVNVLRQA